MKKYSMTRDLIIFFSIHLVLYVLPLSFANAQDALQIEYGDNVNGDISAQGEMDAYVFEGRSGDIVVVRMRFDNPANDPQLELYDPAGKLVSRAAATNSLVRLDTVKLQATGSYTLLAMEKEGDQTGIYGLSLQRTLEPLNAQAISYGESLAASIDKQAEMDAYVFEGRSGDIVVVRMRFDNPANDPQLELYDPAGKLVSRAAATNSLVRLDTVKLQATGSYTLLAMEKEGDQTGIYGLSLQRTLEPLNAQAISYGESLAASIDKQAEMDAYVFEGRSGDIVVVRMRFDNPANDPQLELYDPAGKLVSRAAATNSLVRLDTVKLQATGSYTLLAMEKEGDQAGTYGLSLQRTLEPLNAQAISYGESLAASIDKQAEMDAYVFEGRSGDIVVVRMRFDNPANDPQLELYDPAGKLVSRAAATNSLVRLDTVKLQATGSYTLLAMEKEGDQAGTYDLSLQRTLEPLNAQAISYGESLAASIDKQAEMDAYVFEGRSGDIVVVRMRFDNPANDPQLELYDPAGKLVSRAAATNSLVRLDTVKLQATGSYTLLAMEKEGDQAGTYGLSLQRTLEPLNAQAISYGESLAASIDKQAEMDAYVFEGRSGDIVVVRMRFDNPANDPQLELYDPAGKLVSRAAATNSLVRLDTVKLQATGSYTLLAMEKEGDQAGTYGLSLQRTLEPLNAQAISYGESLAASIDKQAEMDAYVFEGRSGDIVVVRMRFDNPANDPQLELYDPAGKLVSRAAATNSLVRLDTVKLQATGSYTLLAMEKEGDQTGIYGLSLQRTLEPLNAQAISYGESLATSIDKQAEMDAYVFEGRSGDIVVVRMRFDNPANDPQLELYDPAGKLVSRAAATNSLVRLDTVKLQATGSYTLLAMEKEGDQTGAYEISLECIYTITGTTEGVSKYDLLIFPNPTEGFLTIILNRNYDQLTILIRDIKGATIATHSFNDVEYVPLKLEVRSGIYLIDLISYGERILTYKIVKE
jgi:uncharacterized protein YdeI (BOF family)